MYQNNFSQLFDVSQSVYPGMVVYPQNPLVEIQSIPSATGTSTISKISWGSHTGTHIDAPSHVLAGAQTTSDIELSCLVGPCRVIDCTKENTCVTLELIMQKGIKEGERILLKTQNSLTQSSTFNPQFIYLSSAAAEFLAQKVVCIGIDSLSIKQKGSLDNIPHTAFLEKNIPIIEGLNLSQVIEGQYMLVALPIKFEKLDGSPARVILLA